MPDESTATLRNAPAHAEMVADLRAAMRDGRLNVGDRISGEVALGQSYGISLSSVRRGIDLLAREGRLRRKRGSGTYVTAPTGTASTGAAAMAGPIGSQAVRRDTVALIGHVVPMIYHPYYSERQSGLRAGLQQNGWKIWEPNPPSSPSAERDFGRVPFDWDRERLEIELGSRQELAGLFTRPSMLPKSPDWRPAFPVVLPDIWPDHHQVAYDWEEEICTCLRHVMERGAKRIWVLGVHAPRRLERAAQRMAAMLDLPVPELIVRQTTDQVATLTESVQRAFAMAQADFAGGELPADGIVVTSDFEAQGAYDALTAAGRHDALALPAAVMTNKETRLRLPRSVARDVIDGHAHGLAIAELMQQLIVQPELAPRRILMRGRLETAD